MNNQKYLIFAFIGGMIIIWAIYVNNRININSQYMQSILELNIEVLENNEVETSTKLTLKETFEKTITRQNNDRTLAIYPLLGIGFIFLIYSVFVRINSFRDD
ncbi:hypothetical protein AADZ91_18280 [Colwelliaceae bacterium 6441]